MARDERNADDAVRDSGGVLDDHEFGHDVAPPESDTASAVGAVGTANAAGMASVGGAGAGMAGAIIGGVPDDIEQGLEAETPSTDEEIEEFRRIGRDDQPAG